MVRLSRSAVIGSNLKEGQLRSIQMALYSMIFSVPRIGILGIALLCAPSINALDGPQEGAWGVTLETDYFRLIKKAGFNSVRIPIRWSAHASTAAPYSIDTEFFKRVDWAIGQALSRNLAAVINVHHYEEMNQNPVQNRPRLVELWKQVARRYQNQPKSLMFELLNEPHDRLDDERWQDAFPQLLKAIRDSNPDRIILIGPAYLNAVDRLDKMQLPPQDRRIIGTFLPLQFTRQGAFWVNDSAPWRGTNAARAGGVAQGLRARRGMVPPKSPRSGVVDTSCRT
jgi:endoglucanase